MNHASRADRRARPTTRTARRRQAIEGVYAFPHPFGCSQLGDDLLYTQKVLAGLINHPNAAAVLILGLGCENNQMKLLLEQLGPSTRDRIRYFNAQDVADEVEDGIRAVGGAGGLRAPVQARADRRARADPRHEVRRQRRLQRHHRQPARRPRRRPPDRAAAGRRCSAKCRRCSAPSRCCSTAAPTSRRSTATIDLVNDFRDYFRRHDQPIDENPSPGNKDGGITTLAEKSLGCVQKGGRPPVNEVLDYGEPRRPRAAAAWRWSTRRATTASPAPR